MNFRFSINGWPSCRGISHATLVFIHNCHIPLVASPFLLLSLVAVPSSVSHSVYQTTVMLMSLKAQVLLVALEVSHQSLPSPPLGPIVPA